MDQSGDPSISLNSKKLPRILGPLLKLAERGGIQDRRLLLTLLSVSRALPGSHYVPSLDTITSPSTMNPSALEELRILIPVVVQAMDLVIPQPRWSKFHLSTKAGPDGVALQSALKEVQHLTPGVLKALANVGGESLISKIKELQCLDQDVLIDKLKFSPTKGIISKLSLIHSPERKSRIIAIVDYWTQSALKPLHDRIFSVLKTIGPDMTHNQLRSGASVGPGPYHSLDLTSATDRFPVEVQELALGFMINPEYAAA